MLDPDHLRRRCSDSPELFLHVLLLEILDCSPGQMHFAGDVLYRRGSAPPPNEEAEALGVEGVVREPRELLLLHLLAAPAAHATGLDLQVDSGVCCREVSYPTQLAIVDSPRCSTADPAQSFFPRRSRRTMRALGSPNSPRTEARGRNPWKRYSSTNRRRFPIADSCQVSPTLETPQTLAPNDSQLLHPEKSSTRFAEDPLFVEQ